MSVEEREREGTMSSTRKHEEQLDTDADPSEHIYDYTAMMPKKILGRIFENLHYCYWPIIQQICKKWHSIIIQSIQEWSEEKRRESRSFRNNYYQLGIMDDLKVYTYYAHIGECAFQYFVKGLWDGYQLDTLESIKEEAIAYFNPRVKAFDDTLTPLPIDREWEKNMIIFLIRVDERDGIILVRASCEGRDDIVMAILEKCSNGGIWGYYVAEAKNRLLVMVMRRS